MQVDAGFEQLPLHRQKAALGGVGIPLGCKHRKQVGQPLGVALLRQQSCCRRLAGGVGQGAFKSALVALEQVLVIVGGLALGTWMGRELGATIMPFLGHDDLGSQVLPPFIIEISWGTLAITYAAMAFMFSLIITGVILFIKRISLQRILRLGEM